MNSSPLVVFSICAAGFVFDLTPSSAQPSGKPATSKWGKTESPDHDCKFFVSGDELLMSIPGTRAHDLAADIRVTNAPRVVQSVKGDFTIQVCVDGRYDPGADSTKQERTGYSGAALIAMSDAKNVVTLARAVLQRPGSQPEGYANFEMRVGGNLQRMGLTGDHPLPVAGPVWLRLERRGQMMRGAVSTDGSHWNELEPKPLPASWPGELKVGVAGISTSKAEFNPRFSRLQVLK